MIFLELRVAKETGAYATQVATQVIEVLDGKPARNRVA